MSQSPFQPIHEAHAILEQMIFFQFAPPIDRAMPALVALKDELKSEFTAGEITKSIQVVFADNEPTSQEIKDVAGIVIYKPGKTNPKEWAVNINSESISIHCTVYTRWEEIWPIYEKYIELIFAKIMGNPSFLSAVGIKYIDQFLYGGNDEEYDASLLLRQNSSYLNTGAYQSGSRWHCHTGWFDRQSVSGVEVLNQLQVNSGQIIHEGHVRTAVTIDHNQQLRADQRLDQLGDFLPTTKAGRVALSNLMDILHSGNKHVLTNLLNDPSCERVGLKTKQQG